MFNDALFFLKISYLYSGKFEKKKQIEGKKIRNLQNINKAIKSEWQLGSGSKKPVMRWRPYVEEGTEKRQKAGVDPKTMGLMKRRCKSKGFSPI